MNVRCADIQITKMENEDKPRNEGFEGEAVQSVSQLELDGLNLSNNVAIGKKFWLLGVVKFPGKSFLL